MDYVCKRGKRIASDPIINKDLVEIDMTGETMALSHRRCEEAAEMLGVWMVPDGNREKLVTVLKSRPIEWGGKVRRGILPERRLGHHCIPTSLLISNILYLLLRLLKRSARVECIHP